MCFLSFKKVYETGNDVDKMCWIKANDGEERVTRYHPPSLPILFVTAQVHARNTRIHCLSLFSSPCSFSSGLIWFVLSYTILGMDTFFFRGLLFLFLCFISFI
jgi:hypothetical protein